MTTLSVVRLFLTFLEEDIHIFINGLASQGLSVSVCLPLPLSLPLPLPLPLSLSPACKMSNALPLQTALRVLCVSSAWFDLSYLSCCPVETSIVLHPTAAQVRQKAFKMASLPCGNIQTNKQTNKRRHREICHAVTS